MKSGYTTYRILFFTPYYKQNRGNATTAKRIVHGLEQQGYHVFVFAYEEEEWTPQWHQIFFDADLYHILHLKRFASWKKKHQLFLTKPYVLTSGGTDINEDLKDPAAAQLMKSVADESCAITVFSEDGKLKIGDTFPELLERVHVIPQSVWLPIKEVSSIPKNNKGFPKFLLPAGLREVKDVFFLWHAFEQLRIKWEDLTFSIIGAKLDNTISNEVEKRAREVEWFHYLGEVPLEDMAKVYQEYDVILNTSISEGQSTSILEAMYVGKPVLARRNPGNESIVQHGQNGLLFDSVSQFVSDVQVLFDSPANLKTLIEEGQSYITANHQLEKEIALYAAVYTHCMNKAIKNKAR